MEGELADDTLDVWLQTDVRCAFSTFVESYYLIVNGDSLLRTQRTTRTYTSSRSIGSRALWKATLYYHLRSNIYLVLLGSYDWRLRHAELMTITVIGEETSKVRIQHFSKDVVHLEWKFY